MPPEAPATETPTETPYDTMAAVFAELTLPEKKPEPAAAESPTATDEAAQAAAQATADAAKTKEAAPAEGDAKSEEGAEGTPETPKADEGTEGEPAKPKVEEPAVDWEARYKALEAERNRPAPEESKPAAEAKPEPQPPPEIYTAEEKTFLTDYAKEWPDVAKGEALRRRAEYGQLVTHIFNEISKVYGPLVERGVLGAEAYAEDATLNFIRSTHSDYNDAMYDSIVKWANGLSGFKKKLVQETLAQGEPEDVVELITDYKTATGHKKVVQTNQPSAPAVDETKNLSATAKKAAQALGVVPTKRGAVASATPDPNDLDGAWAEAIAGT